MKTIKLPQHLEIRYKELLNYLCGPDGFMIQNKYAELACKILTIYKDLNLPKLDRTDPNYVYLENHHMKPEAFGGSDELWPGFSNRVNLSAKAHFIVHLCYAFCVLSKERKAMVSTVLLMGNTDEFLMKNMNAKLFARLKEEDSKNKSVSNVERFGEEKAAEISKKRHDAMVGISLIERHGEEKAREISKKLSDAFTGVTMVERFGEERAIEINKKRIKKMTGQIRGPKTYEDNRKKMKLCRIIYPDNTYQDILGGKIVAEIFEIPYGVIKRAIDKNQIIIGDNLITGCRIISIDKSILDDPGYASSGIVSVADQQRLAEIMKQKPIIQRYGAYNY